jgi:hypothetical protein
MRPWLLLTTLAAALMLVAPSAGAATVQLPVGEADGVRMVRDHSGALVVVFKPSAARLWRRVAGRKVSVFCEKGPDPDPDDPGTFISEDGGTTFRAPRRGRRLRTGDLTRGMDICRVWLEARTVTRHGRRLRRGRELIVAVPLTQRGAVRLDERARAAALLTVLELAGLHGAFESPADLVARFPQLDRPVRVSVVALPSPADTPAAGSIGYYSDGAEHAAAVLLSASGRRLFLEFDADRVIRTNVAEYLFESG